MRDVARLLCKKQNPQTCYQVFLSFPKVIQYHDPSRKTIYSIYFMKQQQLSLLWQGSDRQEYPDFAPTGTY